MDTLKTLLMNLLDVNKEMDTCLQGLCDWYEKNRQPHAPAEPVPGIAPVLPPTAPVPEGLQTVPMPDELDIKPPADVPSTIVYEQTPSQDTAPSWGNVSYS